MTPDDRGRDILFPLRSNAKSLVAGRGVESVRRRLKIASILFDRVMLEGGSTAIHAGPTASQRWHAGFDLQRMRSNWDTSTARARARGQTFTIAVGAETVPGTPSQGPFTTVAASETTIAWDATLEPFVSELSRACDWIGFTVLAPPTPADNTYVRDWSSRDRRNNVLTNALPVQFVRERVVQDANEDLAAATAIGAAVSADRLHQTVMAERFADESGWGLIGYALPILLPQVAAASWDEIAEVRKLRDLEYFRKTLREVEAESLDGAGGLEERVRDLYAGKLAKATERVASIGSISLKSGASLVIGAGAGFSTIAIAGPLGPIAGGAIGAAAGALIDLQHRRNLRRSVGWVAVDLRIRASGGLDDARS